MADEQAIVHIVDDDEAVRDSLRMLLKSVGQASRQYASAQEFLDAYDGTAPGCLVLDIRMPGMSGLELQEELRKRDCTLPVVFVTGHGDVRMAVQAMQRGAADFIQKPFRDQELLDVIHRVLEAARSGHDHQQQREAVRGRLATLTAREREVLDCVLDGKANKVIAADLGISQRTVEIHRANVMDKMKVRSLAELVRMVLLAEAGSD